MSDYFAAISQGLGHVLTWPNILIPVLGTAIAMIGSFLPGIGNASLAAILIVLTLSWDPVSVLLLFGAMTGGATFMGSITAILFNVPGNASSAAVLLDGHPMARNGQARTAIACAATASATGSIFGVVVLLALLPIVQPLLLEFGPMERVLLGIWGLSTIIAIPNSSPSRALAVTLLGLLCALIGSDPTTGQQRWTFGSLQLYDGFGTIAVLLGFFTLSEIIGWRTNYRIEATDAAAGAGSTREGIASVFRHLSLTGRSSLIGTVIGIIPGVGGTVASFVAYGQAVQTSDHRERFGTGDIRGVIAPEAAVDAKDGGSLLPVLAFGLPGSEAGVILVTVLAIHGFVPGTPMLTGDLPVSLALIFALLMSNFLTSIVGVALSPMLARLTRLRIDRLALPALIASLVTIVQLNGLLADLYVAVGFGLLGYLFKRLDWPRVPFIIAFVLGGFIESNVALTARLVEIGRVSFWDRPASMVLAGLIVVSLLWMLSGRKRAARIATAPRAVGDGWLAAGLTVGAMLVASAPVLSTGSYSPFALGVAWSTAASCALVLLGHVMIPRMPAGAPAIPQAHRVPLALVAAMPVATWAVGLPVAIGMLAALWLRAGSEGLARRPWLVAVLAALVGVATFLVSDRLTGLRLPDPALWSLVTRATG